MVFCQALGSLHLHSPALLGRGGGLESSAGWAWGGSTPGGEQSPGQQAESDRGSRFPAGCPGVSCPAASVLSSVASSTVESSGEESGIQCQVELVGNSS